MEPSKAKRLSVAAGIFLMMFCAGIVNNTTTYFTLQVSEYLKCSTIMFSFYFTMITICSAVISVVIGSIVKKIGIRASMLVSCAMVTGAFILLSRAEHLWMVYAAAVMIGIFQSFIVVPTVSVINAWFHEESGAVTGVVMSATGFGGLLMGAVMPTVIEKAGWRNGYLTCALLYLTVSALANVLAGGKAPDRRPMADGNEKETAAKENAMYQKLLRTPSFWVLMLTACISSGVTMINQQFSILLSGRGYGTTMISVVMGGMSVALALFKIGEGALCDRLPEKVFIPIVFFTGTVGYLALLGHGNHMLLIGVLGYGCSAAGCTVLYPIIMRHLYGPELATTAWGICYAMFMAGSAAWTPIYAVIYDRTGSYDLGLVVAAILLAATALFILIQMSRSPQKKGG